MDSNLVPTETIIPPQKGVFSRGINSMAEHVEKMMREKAAQTPPVESTIPVVPTPVKVASKPAGTPLKTAETPPVVSSEAEKPSVPDFKFPDKPPKAEDWAAAKQSAHDRGVKEAEERVTKSLAEKYVPKEKHDELVKERDELRRQIQTVAIERDPEFRRPFDQRINAAVEMAKRAVGPDLAGEVEKILKSPASEAREEALNRLFETMNPAKAARLSGAITTFEQTLGEFNAALENADVVAKGMMEKKQKAMQDRTQQFNQSFEGEWNNAVEAIETLKDPNVASKLRSRAEFILNVAPADQVAKAAVWAAITPEVTQAFFAEKVGRASDVAKLQAEIDELRGKKPNAAEGDSSSPSADVPMGPGGAAASIVAGLRAKGLI